MGGTPCGTGRLVKPLLDARFQVHGMDISEEIRSLSRREPVRERAHNKAADAWGLKHPEVAFEPVLCARALMHFNSRIVVYLSRRE